MNLNKLKIIGVEEQDIKVVDFKDQITMESRGF